MENNTIYKMYNLTQMREFGKRLSKATSNKRSKKSMISAIQDVHSILNEIYAEYKEYKGDDKVTDYFDTSLEFELSKIKQSELTKLYKVYRKMCLSANSRNKKLCAESIRWLMIYGNHFVS